MDRPHCTGKINTGQDRLLAKNKFNGKPFVVYPNNPAFALDVFFTGGKRNANRHHIAPVQMINAGSLDMGAA